MKPIAEHEKRRQLDRVVRDLTELRRISLDIDEGFLAFLIANAHYEAQAAAERLGTTPK